MTAEAVQKSSWVFANKEGVCDEITNLFISMVRSLGIPARFIAGTVYTNQNYRFESHGWAEVYFPSYGWVPFDVTFGQYGWISPSHVKLMSSADSGNPSVKYEWKSRGIKIKTGKNNVMTKVINKTGKTSPVTLLSIKPLKSHVAPGSYVPLEAKVKNPYQYYIALTLRLVSAPGLEDETIKTLVLKPSEEKSVYWLLKVPEKIDEKFMYTSEIKVKTSFEKEDRAKLQYGARFKKYSKEWAIEKIKELEERQKKEYFTDIDYQCDTDKKTYYSNEEIHIGCTVINSGNQNINNLKFCIEDQCEVTSLNLAEKQRLNFSTTAQEQITIIAETKEKIKSSIINTRVVTHPEISFKLTPKEIKYRERKELDLLISPNTNLYDTAIKIRKKEYNLGNLTNQDHVLRLEARGSALLNGLVFSFKFKDELDREYEIQEAVPITVNNIPFYRKWFSNF